MRVAAIDIGTNSVLLLVAEKRGDRLERICDLATITRLGEGVDQTGRLSAEAMKRTLDCLQTYGQRFRSEGATRVGVVGTSAMRDAAGGSDFVERAASLVGVAPEVISGTREAQLTFGGALTDLDVAGRVAVFDIGGGSTEIIVGADARTVETAVSLDIGSVRLTERWLQGDPPTHREVDALRADVRRALDDAPDLSGVPLVGVAGTITTLAAVAREVVPYDGNAVHGSSLTLDDLSELLSRFMACPVAERTKIGGLHPKRADVIIAGTLIAQAVCERAGAEELVVSDRGVRWGLARELAQGGKVADHASAHVG